MVGQGAELLIPARFKKKTKAGEMVQLVKHVPPNHRDESCSPGFHGGCEKITTAGVTTKFHPLKKEQQRSNKSLA
ncbi:hypothetical protein LEMLEM_LOCUS7255 [Lemmus lemmus]